MPLYSGYYLRKMAGMMGKKKPASQTKTRAEMDSMISNNLRMRKKVDRMKASNDSAVQAMDKSELTRSLMKKYGAKKK